jgi:hypothetical protein
MSRAYKSVEFEYHMTIAEHSPFSPFIPFHHHQPHPLHRSGYLDADAIKRAMGAGISDLEVDEMIAEADCMNTGRINYIDFVKFWRNFILSQNISPLQKFIRVSVCICPFLWTVDINIRS